MTRNDAEKQLRRTLCKSCTHNHPRPCPGCIPFCIAAYELTKPNAPK